MFFRSDKGDKDDCPSLAGLSYFKSWDSLLVLFRGLLVYRGDLRVAPLLLNLVLQRSVRVSLGFCPFGSSLRGG